MNKIITAFVAALLLVIPVAALAGPTTPELLGGLPQDYDVLAGTLPRNRVTGELGRAGNANGYIFLGQVHKIIGGRLEPQYPAPGCPASTLLPEHPLLAKLRAAGVDPDKLAAALR